MAVNEAGLSEPSVPSKPFLAILLPGPPRNLQCVEVYNSAAYLEWEEPPEDGGSKIANYIVEQRLLPSGGWENPSYDSIQTCEYKVAGLIRESSYEFRVFARNATGVVGLPSQVCGPILSRNQLEKPTVKLLDGKKVELESGTTLVLKSSIKGKPRPHAVWIKEDEDLTEDSRSTVTTTRLSSELKLKKVTRWDSGNYRLTVSNASGEASATIQVLVIDSPDKPEGPVEITDVTTKSCVLSWNPPLITGGADVLHYVVSRCNTSKLSWKVVNSQCEVATCRVSNLKDGQEYVYRINAVNKHGMGPWLQSLPMTARNMFGVPDAPGKPESLRTHFNSITIGFEKPQNNGGSKIIGYYVERLKNSGSRWARCNEELFDDLQYRVTGLSEGSSYEFRVYAVNAAGQSLPSAVSPVILCQMPPSPPSAPVVVRVLETTCETATVAWESPLNDNGSEVSGYTVEKSDADYVDEWVTCEEVTCQNTVTVRNLVPNGKYKLRVKAINAAGVSEPCQYKEVVHITEKSEAPELLLDDSFKSHVSVFTGQDICLQASFTGTPKPEVEWSKLGEEIDDSKVCITTVEGKTTLLIENCIREDLGKYILTLTNNAGTKKLSFTVKVFSVPGKVSKIRCKEIKSESVMLSWSSPRFDGCAAVDSYVVEKREVGQQKWSKVTHDCSRSFFKVTGLTEGRSYNFRVTAVNKHGVGVSCETEEAVKASQAPSAPTRVVIDEVMKTGVKFSWHLPRHEGGSRITSYVADVCKSGESDVVSSQPIPADVFTHTFDELEQDVMYDVSVKAQNEMGVGDSSNAVSVLIKDESELPKANFSGREKIVMKAGQNLRLLVPISGKPRPVVSWKYADREEMLEEDDRVKITSSNTDTVLRIKDLERTDSCCYKLNLANKCGSKDYNVNLEVLSPPKPPHGPVEIMAVDNDNVTLAWHIPLDNGGCPILGYNIDYKKVGNNYWSSVTCCTLKTLYKITGLERHNTYQFRISAENKLGCSEPIVSSKVTTDFSYGKPPVVERPNVGKVTQSTAEVSWQAPKTTTPITGYFVELKEKNNIMWRRANERSFRKYRHTCRGLITI